jgi:hypothetical protein
MAIAFGATDDLVVWGVTAARDDDRERARFTWNGRSLAWIADDDEGGC